MMERKNKLFMSGTLKNFFIRKEAKCLRELENYATQDIGEKEIKQLVNKHSLESPKLFGEESISQEPIDMDGSMLDSDDEFEFDPEPNVPIRGVKTTVKIPFRGESELFSYVPNEYDFIRPIGIITGGELHLTYQTPSNNPDRYKKVHQGNIEIIKRYLAWIEKDVKSYNESLESLIRKNIKQRR